MPREISQAHWQIVPIKLQPEISRVRCGSSWERWEPWVRLFLADAFKNMAGCSGTEHPGLSCPVQTSSISDVGVWNDPKKLNPKTG